MDRIRYILLALLALACEAAPLRAQPELLPPPSAGSLANPALERGYDLSPTNPTPGRGYEPLPAPPAAELADEFAPEPQFEHGKPRKIIDAAGWVWGIPRKIILWDRRAVNHNVSAETEQRLAEYLYANGIVTTKVRINQYDPLGEWQRLRANKEVGAGWRYTVGAFGTLTYTLLPGRVFGKDRYNPYTNSIYIYSDIPCIAQEQGSFARLIQARAHPGTYAMVTYLPVVQLWPKKQVKNDVLDYTLAFGTPDAHGEATRILYAEYGAEIGGQAALFVGSNVPLTLAGAGIGHVAARFSPNPSADPIPEASASTPELTPASTPDIKLTAGQTPATAPETQTR
jgi:hypothetical protein